MSMRPIDLQSIISGVKETEKVQRAHEVRSQQQAHDFEVNMRRKERDDPKTVHGVAKGEAPRVVERKREGEGREEGRKGAQREGSALQDGEEGEKKAEEGHTALYNGSGRIRDLRERDGPHDILI